MGLAIITPPAADKPAVTVQEAAEHLNITSDELPAHAGNITRVIAAVSSWLSGHDGWLGRSLVAQTLELSVQVPYWGLRDTISLPRPPFLDLVSVKYVDAGGDEYPLAMADFLISAGADGFARLGPASRLPWPAVEPGGELRIRYRAGYGAEGTAIEPGLRQAILMTVARMFENRGDGLAGSVRSDPFIAELFAPYRVWGPPC